MALSWESYTSKCSFLQSSSFLGIEGKVTVLSSDWQTERWDLSCLELCCTEHATYPFFMDIARVAVQDPSWSAQRQLVKSVFTSASSKISGNRWDSERCSGDKGNHSKERNWVQYFEIFRHVMLIYISLKFQCFMETYGFGFSSRRKIETQKSMFHLQKWDLHFQKLHFHLQKLLLPKCLRIWAC